MSRIRPLTKLVSICFMLSLVSVIVVTSGSEALAASPNASTPGVTKNSVKIGGVITATSASGFSEAQTDVGVRARINQQNAAGGVAGRKIDYVGSQDDGLNPSTDLQLTQKLVQTNDVFAVVPVGAPAFSGGGNFLIKNQVPFIGWATTPPFCGNPYGFGIFGCDVVTGPDSKVSTATGGMLKTLLHGSKGKTVAAIAADTEAGKASLPSAVDGIQATGFKIVYNKASLPGGAVTDYTPYARDIMTSNNGGPPDAIYYGVESSQVIGLRAALTAAGFKGIGIDGVTYDPTILSNARNKQILQGEYVSVPFEPFSSNTPAVKTMLAALKKQAGKSFTPSQYMAYGYWMADMFIAMLKKVGPNLTRATFMAATKNFVYHVPGGTGVVAFPAARNAPSPCSAAVQIVGSKFVTKLPLQCYSNVPLPK